MTRGSVVRHAIAGLALSTFAAGVATNLIAAQVPSSPPNVGQERATYTLQHGDELSIKVFGRPELDDTVTVRPDGRISAPLVDDVDAAGQTIAALDEMLTSRLAKFFRDPQVTVIVRRIANLKVFVGGEVGAPGVIPITGELTALAAVYQAGGFRPTARTDSVMLLRQSDDAKPTATRLDLKRLQGDQALMTLQPHDVLYVPMSRIAKVDRFIDQYARQLLPISLTAGFSYVMGDAFVPK
jgi:polysaccharide export outer membrane protein